MAQRDLGPGLLQVRGAGPKNRSRVRRREVRVVGMRRRAGRVTGCRVYASGGVMRGRDGWWRPGLMQV